MPFELGLDLGFRRAPDPATDDKQFLVMEATPYQLKRCLSDLAGMDVVAHQNDYLRVIKHTREFLTIEAQVVGLPGATRLADEYAVFLGWMTEAKLFEGHTEHEATELPTGERLASMQSWMTLNRPSSFLPPN